jgi:hypothetical protein
VSPPSYKTITFKEVTSSWLLKSGEVNERKKERYCISLLVVSFVNNSFVSASYKNIILKEVKS